MPKTQHTPPTLSRVTPPATPPLDEIVKLLRATDLGEANRQIAADYPATTLEERCIMLRAATKVIWEAWIASDARKKREKLARRNRARRTLEHDPVDDAEAEEEDC